MKLTTLQALGATALISLAASTQAMAAAQDRIVGGSDIDISVFPSTVALLNKSRLDSTNSAFQAQFCGGTLIGSNWVLTAAHCVEKDGVIKHPSAIMVLAGSTDLEAPVTVPTAVSRVIIHADYRSVIFGDDIALLELASNAPAPAIAMLDTRAAVNQVAYVAGWGVLEEVVEGVQPRFTSVLQGAAVQVQSSAACANLTGDYSYVNPQSQLCAGVAGGGVDSCSGDSGGPIYTATKQNTLRVAGITSWGEGCARANKPGVYTDVAAYRAWIDQNMRNTTPVAGGGSQIGDTQFTTLGSRYATGGAGASILLMPLLMLLLCIRFKPFVLLR